MKKDMLTKTEIRKSILTSRKALSAEQCSLWSSEITKRLVQLPLYQQAECIYAYIDVKGEVRTEQLIRQAWADGKHVAVPRVVGPDLVFYRIHSYQDLQPGYFNIPEPVDCVEETCPDPLVIIPGVAFDENGSRIGYGKGFYDRFLHSLPDCRRAAIAYEMQLVEKIPAESHDIRPEYLITEQRTLQF